MPVPAAGVLRITARMKSTIFGDYVGVYHVRADIDDTASDADIIAACVSWLNNAYDNINAGLVSSLDPYDVRVDLVEMTAGVERLVRTLGTVTWTMTSPPSSSGEATASMDAGIVNFRTALPRVFGRKYIAGFAETNTAGGVLSGSIATSVAAWAADLVAGFTNVSVQYALGVLSNKSTASNKFALITAAVVNTIMGTQRRRRINRGS